VLAFAFRHSRAGRTDIAQDEIGKLKVVVEEIELADRMNEIVAEYDKYLQ
jgi:hypothetical protein